ncbi:MAG: sulfatase [Gemmatimonadetes bacterium]|nr:sulfatase [Gemmatimonadota bacterium]
MRPSRAFFRHPGRARHKALGLAILFLWGGAVLRERNTARVVEEPLVGDIVLIVTDDQPWHTLQFMPNTNALIGDAGVRFSNAFASTPLCCPSRASILTGLYTHNHGVKSNASPSGGARLFQDASTLATWLKAAGYRTALLGKYLNEYNRLTPWPYIPPGWDEWQAFVFTKYYDYTLVENGIEVRYGRAPEEYSTDVLTKKAVRFIESAPSGQRLFLYYAPFAPHGDPVPAPRHRGTMRTLQGWRPPSYNEADVSDKPAWVRNLAALTLAGQDSTDRFYRKQVETLLAVDDGVADIVAALDRSGRLGNAAIVYTSDHGLALGEHRYTRQKNCFYESCVRVPLLVRAPGAQPRVDPSLMLNVDLAPTIAQWAGVTLPAAVNGRSFAPLLSNPESPWRDAALLEVLGGSSVPPRFQGVRTSRYAYAEYRNGERELYDLQVDPDQTTNVHADPAYASTASTLHARLAELKRE